MHFLDFYILYMHLYKILLYKMDYKIHCGLSDYSKFPILLLINTKYYSFAECSCFHKLISKLLIFLVFVFPFDNFKPN